MCSRYFFFLKRLFYLSEISQYQADYLTHLKANSEVHQGKEYFSYVKKKEIHAINIRYWLNAMNAILKYVKGVPQWRMIYIDTVYTFGIKY